MSDEDFYFLSIENTDPKRLKRERERARELKKSTWWKQKKSQGICHYCGNRFKPDELTMDHVVPIARGGESTKNNIVTCCKECNAKKKLATPVDLLLKQIEKDKS